MPELPEVETVRRQLEETVINQPIDNVQVFTDKITRENKKFARLLIDLSFTKIDRVGKLLIFETTDPNINLLAHLKMTGKFLFREGKKDYDKHTHIVWSFRNSSELLFNDVRRFGYVVLADKKEVEEAKSKFGIEPLTDKYTYNNFDKIFANRKANIKALLLNQSLLAGLGNIYVDEVLFCAGVLPTRRANAITKDERKKIFSSIEKIIRDATDKGGTTFSDFAHTDGQAGSYASRLQVFARLGKPCFKCGKNIEKTRVAGRGTHFCPNCQG